MIVKNSMIVSDSLTVFQMAEDLPVGTFYVSFDGEKHELFAVYGGITTKSYAIKGKYDLTGKDVQFVGKEGIA